MDILANRIRSITEGFQDIEKSHVKSYTKMSKTGKFVTVKEHDDKRTKKEPHEMTSEEYKGHHLQKRIEDDQEYYDSLPDREKEKYKKEAISGHKKRYKDMLLSAIKSGKEVPEKNLKGIDEGEIKEAKHIFHQYNSERLFSQLMNSQEVTNIQALRKETNANLDDASKLKSIKKKALKLKEEIKSSKLFTSYIKNKAAILKHKGREVSKEKLEEDLLRTMKVDDYMPTEEQIKNAEGKGKDKGYKDGEVKIKDGKFYTWEEWRGNFVEEDFDGSDEATDRFNRRMLAKMPEHAQKVGSTQTIGNKTYKLNSDKQWVKI